MKNLRPANTPEPAPEPAKKPSDPWEAYEQRKKLKPAKVGGLNGWQKAAITAPALITALFIAGNLPKADGPQAVTEIDMQVNCRQAIRARLRDPGSFQVVEEIFSTDADWKYFTTTYRAKNGFGGTNVEAVKCTFGTSGDVLQVDQLY